jgi:hypothetical protein
MAGERKSKDDRKQNTLALLIKLIHCYAIFINLRFFKRALVHLQHVYIIFLSFNVNMFIVFKNCLCTFCGDDTTVKLRRTMNFKLKINFLFKHLTDNVHAVLCKSYKNTIFRLLQPRWQVPLINKHENCKFFLKI